ncbi:MAG: Xaa-Pro dipeptidase [Thermomicrobiales bacterium]|nr:Xaa-Pro dipeptidase [Thermomicrobiales bacterium]
MAERLTAADWYVGATRGDRVRDAIARKGLDVLLALTPENAHYLAGYGNYIATHWRLAGIFSVAVGPSGERIGVSGDFGADPAIAPPFPHLRYRSWTESIDVRGASGASIQERVRAARPGGPLARPVQFDLDEVFDRVAEAVHAAHPRPHRVGVDLQEVEAPAVQRLKERLPAVKLVDATAVFNDLRAIKDPDEIDHLYLAGELTEGGIAGAIARLRPGMTEVAVNSAYEIAVHERLLADARYAGFRQAEGLATIGIGASTPKIVAPGQTIKFDMQVDVAGYHSDVGRTVAFAPTADQREVYAALRNALAAAQERVRPGVPFAAVYDAGIASMRSAGFSNYSRGHLGHSVGLTQHFEEPPFVAAGESREIVPEMVLSLELPYYVYGVGAFQLERILLVTSDGHEAIDRLPFELELPPR